MALDDLLRRLAETPDSTHNQENNQEPTPTPEPPIYGNLPTIPDTDNRRTCRQCMNLRGRVCSVASPGGIVSANRGYAPDTDTMQRCNGYLPDPTDEDQRPGTTRWPGLSIYSIERNTK